MTDKFEYPLKKDTKAAEENFFDILIEKKSDFGSNTSETRFKTVFLNGQWGGGKTQFIESVKSKHNYRRFWEYFFKLEKGIEYRQFVQLELWEIEDSRTILAIAFSKLFPLIYWTMKIIGVVLVSLSIAVSPILGLNLLWFFDGHPILKGTVSIALLGLGVWQFLKFKSDSVYKAILSSSIMSKFLKKKILYIDDFDRVSEKEQIEAYKVFNILSGKLPILFMGDYSKIQMVDEDNYLSKIIDERLELPVVLHSHYIMEEILKQFEKEFIDEEDNIFSFENTFKDFILLEEHRTLREIEQLCETVNHEFITRAKQGRVQPYQQLLIIYVHMFYPRVYKNLAELTQTHALNFKFITAQELFKEIPDVPDNKQVSGNSITITTDNPSDERICEVVNEMLSKNQNNIFPIPFLQNVKGYLLNESISNMNKSEANEILDNLENYPEILFGNSRDKRDDFVTFISQEYSKLPTWTTDNDWMTSEYNQYPFLIKKLKLEKFVFKYIKKNFDRNNLTKLVVDKLSIAIFYEAKNIFESIPSSQSIPRNVNMLNKRTHCNISPNTIKVNADVEYILWNQYLHEFDLSEKIYFICIYKVGYASSTNPHFKDLLTKEVDIYIKDKFEKKEPVQVQKHEAYLYWLKCKSDPDNFYFSKVIKYVNILSVREYILFWTLMGLLVEKESNPEGIVEDNIIHLNVFPGIYFIFNQENTNYDKDDFMKVKFNIMEKVK